MNETDFEGSRVLEMLAEVDLLDEFYEAIDDDNISKAVMLMRKAQIDEETIDMTIEKIQESSGRD
jgi:hypothetical protein